jgi:hypothetical protein
VGLIAALGCEACTSDYLPRPGPRLSMVQESGSLVYVRDGKKIEGGFLGGGIEDAVQGVPQAEAYAHQYKSGMVTGFALTLVGVAGIIGGLTLTTTEASSQPNQSSNNSSAVLPGLLVMGAGAIVEIIGTIVMSSAQPHLFDAVNAYNDGVESRGGAPAPAPVPTVVQSPPVVTTP